MSGEAEDWAQAMAERLRARSQDRGFDEEVTALVVAAFELGVFAARGGAVPELDDWAWVDEWEWSVDQHTWFKRGGGSDEDADDATKDGRG